MYKQRPGRGRRAGKVVRRGRRPGIEPLEPRRLLATVQWVSTTSGDWGVGSNWSTGQVPGGGDDVIINVTGATPTVTIDSGNQSVNSLTADDPLVLSGGGLTVGSASTIGGPFTFGAGGLILHAPLTLAGSTQWSGGGVNLDGNTLTNTGPMTITGSQDVAIFANNGGYGNQGGSLVNQGTVFVTGAGGLKLFDNVRIDNAAQGTYGLAADSGLDLGNGSPFVTNEGLFEKTGGTGTSAIGIPFDNRGGTVAADSGTLSLAAGGTSTGGTYNAAAGATLDLSDGTQQATFTGTYTGSGAGAINRVVLE